MGPEDLIGVQTTPFPEMDAAVRQPPGAAPQVDPDSLQAQVTLAAQEARDWFEQNIEPDMIRATDFYYGRPFGVEEEGRSTVVSTDVRDVTMSQMPDLLRIFLGPEDIVRFNPVGAEDEALAQEMTSATLHAIRHSQDAFLHLHGCMKDALVRRIGWLTWWWEGHGYQEQTVIGDAVQMEQLMQDPAYQVLALEPDPSYPGLFTAQVEYTADRGRAGFAAVPPEEISWNPGARSIDDVEVFVWGRERPVSDLVEMGYDLADIEDHIGRRPASGTDDLTQARLVGSGVSKGADMPRELRQRDRGPTSRRMVYFAEVYMYVDSPDVPGLSELRRFDCVGSDYAILNGEGEVVEEIPFASFVMEPEPHTMVGLSNYDLQSEVQLVKSQMLRDTLDSLGRSLDERMEVVADEVNLADLMNPANTKFVRVRRQGMINPIPHTFVGGQVLPLLQYYDQVREERGVPRAAAGLDPDALQSSTRAGVVATVQGARAKVEMIARIFAETGFRRFFRGIAGLIHRNGAATKLRLNGQIVPVNPSAWDLSYDVEVEVALGVTDRETQIQQIQQIIEAQAMLMQTGSPLISNVEIGNAFRTLIQLNGHKNTAKFLRPWGPQEEQQFQQQQAEAQAATIPPDQMMFMLEQAKQALESRKLDIEESKAQADADFKRDELAQKAALESMKMELEGMKVRIQELAARQKAARESQGGDSE